MFVGANTVKSPVPSNVATNPALSNAWTKMLRFGFAEAMSAIVCGSFELLSSSLHDNTKIDTLF